MNYNEINWFELKGSHFFNDDCMKVMQAMPDKWADIAIVDPPYNVGASDGNFGAHPGCYRKDLKHYANHN